jgi:hypothetical protein
VLYYGYSNEDPNWREVVRELQEEFAPSMPPAGYRLDPHTPALEKEILQGQGILTIEGNLAQFHAEVDVQMGDFRVEPYQMAELASRVPPDLKYVFDEFPAAVVRLINSWEYVNQVDFSGIPNHTEFFRAMSLIGRLLDKE